MMDDWTERLVDESEQLHVKIVKLQDFLKTDRYQELGYTERGLLKEQLVHMLAYHAVLGARLAARGGV